MTGWDAIEAALGGLYPSTLSTHFAPARKLAEGGSDPLDNINAYWNEGPIPHWHYVTFGLTELYAKESKNADTSGWGFELSFRVAAEPATPAPEWPVTMLQMLARYVFKRHLTFMPGDHIDFGGPINDDPSCNLVALAFAHDPKLRPMRTPNGDMIFVAPYGLTRDEKPTSRHARADFLLAKAQHDNPLLITDIAR